MQIQATQIKIDSTWFSPERDVVRSKGLHLSHVIDFILNGELRTENAQSLDSLHAHAAAGFLWERVLEKVIELKPTELWDWLFARAMVDVHNPSIVRPGEMCVDGIYLTPDGYNIEDMCLEEWKYTKKSSKYGIEKEKFDRWVKYQIPAYLHALGLTKCRLRVYFARGNYTGANMPEWWQYDIEYSPWEIQETWDMILLNAQHMIEHGLVDTNRT